MVNKVKYYKKHWRDILVIMTAILVLSSLVLVAFGIAQNNRLANQTKVIAAQSKAHLDCIIKDFETPIPPGAASRYISKVNTDCDINFTSK